MMKIEYQEVPLAYVMRYYAADFKAREGEQKPVLLDYFIDPIKDKVIFVVGITPQEPKDKQS